EWNRAERNLIRLVDALDSWYTDFANHPELKAENLTSVRKEFLTAALREFEQLGRELGNDARVEGRRIRAMVRVAQAQDDLGEKSQAVNASRFAIEHAEAYYRKDPSDWDRQHGLTWAIHESLTNEPDLDRARAGYWRAEEVYEAAMRTNPDRPL